MTKFLFWILLSAVLNVSSVLLAERRTQAPDIPAHEDPRAKGLAPSEQLERVRRQTLPQNTDRYFDGIPPVFFKGKECSQSSSSAHSTGGMLVNVNCYLDDLKPRRQCSFRWNSHDKTAEISIATYIHEKEGDWESTEQTHFPIAKRGGLIGIALKEVPDVAQKMIDEFCGTELPPSSKAVYRETNIDPVNGIPCTYSTRQYPPTAAIGFEIYCHHIDEQGNTLQCHASKRGETNKKNFNSAITLSVLGYAGSQNGKTRDQEVQKEITVKPDHSLGFEGQARKWLEKNCKK